VGNATVPMGKYTKIKTGKLDANASSPNGIYPFFTCSRDPLKISSYSYDCECVLVAGNGDLNVKYYTGKFDAYQRTYIIESSDKHKLDTRYLYCFLDKYVEKLREQSIGGVIKYIKLGHLTEAPIPLPPLEVQRRIADVLDRASALIEKRKAQIDKLDLLIKAQFVEMFGDPVTNPKRWKYSTLENIADIASSKRIFESEYVSEGVPFFRTKEIVELSKGKSISTELFITEERYNEIKTKYEVPQIGNMLVSAVGTIGVIWVVDTNEPFYFKDGNLLWIRCRVNSNSIFMKYLLTALIDYYKKDLVAGSSYNALTIIKLKQMKTHNPPLQLQTQFATFVQSVEVQKTHLQQSLVKLEQSYQSLMQKCFRGDIF